MRARGLIELCLVLLAGSFAPACIAQSLCDPFNVVGNETEAPIIFLQAFQDHNWKKIDSLLVDDVRFTYVEDSKVARGRVDVVAALRSMYNQNMTQGMIGYNYGKVDLKTGHWVAARLYPKFKPEEIQPTGRTMAPPPFLPPHPSHYPAYSISFLPDCRGKIVSLFVVDRDLISD